MHPLYRAAADADESFNRAIAAASDGKRGRWTMIPSDWLVTRVKVAYQQKIEADAAWLDFMRADSLARSARR